MFDQCGSKLVSATLSGQNGCLFTYGASGSGKTYTMMGQTGEEAGLLPRTLESLFKENFQAISWRKLKNSFLIKILKFSQSVSSHLYDKTDIRPTGSAYISRVGVNEEKTAKKVKADILSKISDEECNSGDWHKSKRRSFGSKFFIFFMMTSLFCWIHKNEPL